MTDPTTVAAPAPALVAAEPPAPVEKTLAQFRAEKAASLSASAEPEPPPTPAPAPPVVAAQPAAPVDPPDEGEDEPGEAAQAQPQPPQQDPRTWRWKDPDSGQVLDMRRKESKRIKRLLEERADLARQLQSYRQPAPAPQEPPQAAPARAPQAAQPDPDDPEPTLEQFAEQTDPYLAHARALARWEARQEFKQQHAASTKVERERQVAAALSRAQSDYDAGLPQARERYPDFDDAHTEVLETLGRLPMPARGPLVQRLLTSPIRHDLTHYLGSHPEDLAAVVSARNAYEQGLTLGAIETRVRALVNQRHTPATPNPPAPLPAPMAPVNSGGTPTAYNPSTANLAQFRRKHGVLGGRSVSA